MAEEAKVPVVPAPTEARYPDGSLIKKGAQSAEFWPTQEKAEQIAAGRQKGARIACIVKDKTGKVRFATTTHPHYLEEYILCTELGYEVTQIGKDVKSKAPVTATSVVAAIDSIPDEETREKVRKQLADLLKAAPIKK